VSNSSSNHSGPSHEEANKGGGRPARLSRREFGLDAAVAAAAAFSLSPPSLLANIIRKYGDRLSEEQRKHLGKILAYNEAMLAPVRAFALQNGDPSATVLKLSSGKKSQ
jgi:hypothetical protein